MQAKIEEKLTEEPEFVDKPIEEGDYLSNLLGKENRGRVIGIGMGPTPASLGLPGTKSTARTSLQLEREARHRAEEEVRALKEGKQQLEERMKEQMERRLAEKMAEFKAMKHTSPEQRHPLNKPTEEHSCSSASNNVKDHSSFCITSIVLVLLFRNYKLLSFFLDFRYNQELLKHCN